MFTMNSPFNDIQRSCGNTFQYILHTETIQNIIFQRMLDLVVIIPVDICYDEHF